jgi:hypothetical protein
LTVHKQTSDYVALLSDQELISLDKVGASIRQFTKDLNSFQEALGCRRREITEAEYDEKDPKIKATFELIIQRVGFLAKRVEDCQQHLRRLAGGVQDLQASDDRLLEAVKDA